MKKILLAIGVFCALASAASAQKADRFSFAVLIGTGIAVNTPASTPFTWQVSGWYDFNGRFSVGVGTGVSVYEKPLVPVFAGVKFNMIKPRKFTPYLECSAGYGFAPNRNANGGLYLNPSVGIRWAPTGKRINWLFVAGYEIQKLERLKRYDSQYFKAEFSERLSHNVVSIRVGVFF